jgi:hypothetical protein
VVRSLRCVGKDAFVVNSDGSVAGREGACWCGRDCHTCDWSVEAVHQQHQDASGPSDCEMCKNGMYLNLHKVCGIEATCRLQGGVGVGRGLFGRTCVFADATHANGNAQHDDGNINTLLPPSSAPAPVVTAPQPGRCVRKQNNCHQCSEANPKECAMCYRASYLHNGGCQQDCPADTKKMGSGQFNRRCVESATPTTTHPLFGCTPKSNDCHVCDNDRTKCTMCYHATYLFEGACIRKCPSKMISRGTGNFHRRCI